MTRKTHAFCTQFTRCFFALSMLFVSQNSHALYVQINVNRPVLNDPNVVVMTFYDDELLGPYHVAIYNTPFGYTQPELLYMTSHENIQQATEAHFGAMLAANSMFPDVESYEVSQMLQSRFVHNIIHHVNPNQPPLPAIPDEVQNFPPRIRQNNNGSDGLSVMVEETPDETIQIESIRAELIQKLKPPEKGSFKSLRKKIPGGCKPKDKPHGKDEKKDDDEPEDCEEFTNLKQIPNDFKSVRISATHLSFFK